MEVLALALIIGVIPGYIAQQKGRSFVGWWLYGALLFVVALPHALIIRPDERRLEKRQLASGMKKCPFCAEMIKREAVVCRFCGKDLTEQTERPATPATSTPVIVDEELAEKSQIKKSCGRWVFRDYRYENKEDALAYARTVEELESDQPPPPPTTEELIEKYHIKKVAGHWYLRHNRFDKRQEAVDFARTLEQKNE